MKVCFMKLKTLMPKPIKYSTEKKLKLKTNLTFKYQCKSCK